MTYKKTEVSDSKLSPNQIGKLEYQTMVTPLDATRQQLVGWHKPTFAYVLFEKKEWHLKADGYKEPGAGLLTLNVEGRPEQEHQVDYYLKKGYRIIDYGNFPRFDDPNGARAAKARLYSQGAGINPWSNLENHIKTVGMNYDPHAKQREEESTKRIADLEARVAQFTAQAEEKDVKRQRDTKADTKPAASPKRGTSLSEGEGKGGEGA